MWIAAETIKTPSFDLDALMERCGNDNQEIRAMARREWCRRIGRALIVKDAYGQFLAGEDNYNGPKICEKTHKTILKADLTQIILDHRAKVQAWFAKKMQRKKEQQLMKNPAAQVHAPSPVPVSTPDVVIEGNDDLESWEELAESD